MPADQPSKLAAQAALNAIEDRRRALKRDVDAATAELKAAKDRVHELAMTVSFSEQHKLDEAEAERDAAGERLKAAKEKLDELEKVHPSNLDHWK